MREVLSHYREGIETSPVLAKLGLEPGAYFVVSAHREENVDNPATLRRLLGALRAVASEYRLPIVFSTHQMSAVESLCDRIFMINNGRRVLYGPLQEIRKKFDHLSLEDIFIKTAEHPAGSGEGDEESTAESDHV